MKTTIQKVLIGFAAVAVLNAPSTFGAGTDTLIFSHQKHIKDAGTACTDCHKETADNTGKGPITWPPMTVCGSCHQEELDAKNCAMCHTSPTKAKKHSASRKHPEFSHKGHLGRGAECTVCHKGLDNAARATEKNLPDMDACFTCHNDKKARKDCSLCHLDLSKIKPASHRAVRFLKEEHGKDARFNASDCEKCHQQSSCDQCHQGQLSTRIHNPNYRNTHGLEAKRRDKNCAMCHEIQNPCTRCHTGQR